MKKRFFLAGILYLILLTAGGIYIAAASDDTAQQDDDAGYFDTVQLDNYVEPESEEVQYDFLNLYDQNADIVGWLQAGETIDYPVLQKDNDYYLHHDFYGNPDRNGSVFVNECNMLWPRDWLVLIHGHHTKSGVIFGRLQDYEDFDYVCRYPLINFRTIYDPENVYYAPVAAFNASMEPENPDYFYVMEPWEFYYDEYMRLAGGAVEPVSEESASEEPVSEEPDSEEPAPEEADGEGSEGDPEETEEEGTAEVSGEIDPEELVHRLTLRKEAYLESFLERSLWKSPLEADADDKYLMLLTCSYYQEDGRFLLLCRKLRDDETPEETAELFAGELAAEEETQG